MKIVVLVTVWRRLPLARAVIENIMRLGLTPFVVLSSEDVAEMTPWLTGLGVDWCVAPNHPVSCKHQLGLSVLRRTELGGTADAVMLLGSDDFVNAAYVSEVASRLESSRFIGVEDVWMFGVGTGCLGYWGGPMALKGVPIPVGAGRVWRRDFLDECDWILWPEAKDSGLDSMCSRLLIGRGEPCDLFRLGIDGDVAIVDVKSGFNIHGWRKFHFDSVLGGPQAASKLKTMGLGVVLEVAKHDSETGDVA